MLSRWNLYRAITANTRLLSLGPRASYSVCLAKKSTAGSVYQPAQNPCHGHDRNDKTSEQPPLPPPPPPSPPPPPLPTGNDENSQNIFQRFKNMAKKYWYIVLPVHLVTSTIWFGSFYFIASSGVDVPALLESLKFPDWIIDKVKNGNSWTSYLVIAYGLYKICTPLRYMVTLGGTTMVKRYLQRIGYFGGSPKKP